MERPYALAIRAPDRSPGGRPGAGAPQATASQTGEGVGSGVRPIVVDFTRCRRASSVDLPT